MMNDKYIVMGLGVEGEASLRFLLKNILPSDILVSDQNEKALDSDKFKELTKDLPNENIFLGENYLDALNFGNIVVKSTYSNGTTLFPTTNETTGWDKPYNEILLNWQFPFLKGENGYYSFNSDQYHVTRDYQNKKFVLHKGARAGFYPFNSCNDDTTVMKNRDLYFTAKFEIPFLMNSNGKIKNSTTGQYEDMVFNFSGDDDVWIFVDDQLVVDLGGLHIKQTGDINFSKNQVHYSSVYDENNNKDISNYYAEAIKGGRLKEGEHTLKVFYMEFLLI